MKQKFIWYGRHLLRHWKTSILGVIVLLSLLFWTIHWLSVDDFLKLLAFAASLGFFSMPDPPTPSASVSSDSSGI